MSVREIIYISLSSACIERGRVVDWTQHRLFNNLLDHAADGAKPSQMGIKQFTAKASNNTTSSNISSTSASSPQPLPPPSPSQSRPMMHPPPSRIVDTNAPNFVSNYFETSRLHHISTWKNDLKQYVADSLQQQHQQHSHTFDDGSNFANFNKNNKKQQQLQTLFHVDMDCFFASVALLDRPQYANSPVAIAHSTNIGKQQLQSSSYSSSSSSHLKDSTSEIASCNYVARGFGLRNGMMLSKALALCPKLNVLPYEFDKINRVSLKLYDVLMEYTPLLQVCSCDEAIIDVTKLLPPLLRNGGGFGGGGGGGMSLFTASSSSAPDAAATATTSSLEAHRNEAILLANQIRIDIFEATGGCSASVGISHNILLTRIATKRAKPNGVFYIPAHSPDFVFGLLDDRPVDELPGVGRTLKTRLRDEAGGVETVGQLRGKRLDSLQSQFGTKTGLMLYNFSRGIDTRSLQLAGAVVEPGSTPNSSSSTAASSTLRNSISAEVNWGIRFDDSFQQVVEFLEKLSLEVAARMKRAGGYTASGICIKLKRRSEGQGEARKLMGHGICGKFFWCG